MSTLPVWYDRERTKVTLQRWLPSDKFGFLLNIADIQEMEDIIRWFREEHTRYSIADIYIDTEIINSKYHLMEQIISELGKDNFPDFKKYELLNSKFDIKSMINQSLGSSASSENDQSFHSITQSVSFLDIDPSIITQNFKESKATDAIEYLLKDLKILQKKNPILIIFRLQGEGFERLSKDFKNWVVHEFIKDLAKIQKIKICFICQGNCGDLNTIVNIAHKQKITNLNLVEIITFAHQFIREEEMFCRGMVDEDEQVEYRIFKLKLYREFERQSINQ